MSQVVVQQDKSELRIRTMMRALRAMVMQLPRTLVFLCPKGPTFLYTIIPDHLNGLTFQI